MSNSSKKTFFIMIIVIIVATGLRLFYLSKDSLWLDEAFSVDFSSRSFLEVLRGEKTNPPFYYLLLYFWMKVFGKSEFAIRMLSVIPSIAAVFITYLIGKKKFSVTTGLIAAAFMAVSSFQIGIAQEARTFAWLLLILNTSLLFLLLLCDTSPSKRKTGWVLYTTSCILSMYAHYIAMFFILGHAVYVWFNRKNENGLLKNWIISQIIVGIAFIPRVIITIITPGDTTQAREYLLLKLPQALFSFLVGNTVIPLDRAAKDNLVQTFLTYWPFLLIAAVIYAIITFYSMKQFVKRKELLFFVTFLILPLLIPYLISFKKMMFDERYLVAVAPVLFIFMAIGIEKMFRCSFQSRAEKISFFFVIFFYSGLSLYSLFNIYFNDRFGKEQWREVVNAIETKYQKNLVVLLEPGYLQHPYRYYKKDEGYELLLLKVGHENELLLDTLKYLKDNFEHIVLVRAHTKDKTVEKVLCMNFEIVDSLYFKKSEGIKMLFFKKTIAE